MSRTRVTRTVPLYAVVTAGESAGRAFTRLRAVVTAMPSCCAASEIDSPGSSLYPDRRRLRSRAASRLWSADQE